jgi:uncharacterized protein
VEGVRDKTEAGWYDDPAGLGQFRFWDGVGWTANVATDGRVAERPLPPDRAAIPGRGGWLVAAGLIGGVGSALLLGVIARAVAPGQFLLRLVPSQFALWTFLIGACIAASRRYGTGRLRDDFGLRSHPADVGRGLVLSLLGRLAALLALIPLVLLDRDLVAGNTQLLHLARQHWTDFAVIAVFAVIGAPLVEELFFRGLLMRVLEPAWGRPAAIAGQAIVFGCCHVTVLLGLRNTAVVLATGAFGVVQGIAVARYRRLGPGIWSHAFFNAVAVLAIAA